MDEQFLEMCRELAPGSFAFSKIGGAVWVGYNTVGKNSKRGVAKLDTLMQRNVIGKGKRDEDLRVKILAAQ